VALLVAVSRSQGGPTQRDSGERAVRGKRNDTDPGGQSRKAGQALMSPLL